MGLAVASRCVPGSGLAAAFMDLAWWSAVLAWVVGRRSAACTTRMAASTVRAVRHRWEARPTLVPLLLSVPPLMLAALAVALLVRCGDDVGTACLRSAAWPPDPPRSSARIRARARADPADPAVGIAPELAALDRELAAVGGVARGDADDIYACGPPAVVFEAVARFAEAVERELGLVPRRALTL